MNKKVLFSVNEYDSEGDIVKKGIFLHFDQTRVKVAETLLEFKEFVGIIGGMYDEIKMNKSIINEANHTPTNQDHGRFLHAAFSPDYNTWCVYDINGTSAKLIWKCKTKEGANVLADEINKGTIICRGDKILGTACGKCLKCKLTV